MSFHSQNETYKMRRYFIGTWLSLGIILVCLSVASAEAPVAKNKLETLTLKSEETLVSAYGLVLLGEKETEVMYDDDVDEEIQLPRNPPQIHQRKATVKKLKGNTWEITVSVDPSDYQERSKITAIAMTRSNGVVPANVRWLQKPASEVPGNSLSCRKQERTSLNRDLINLDEKALRSVVSFRKTKQKLYAKQLKEILTPEVLKKLNGVEEVLGVTHPKKISVDISLRDLAFRVGVIDSLLINQKR